MKRAGLASIAPGRVYTRHPQVSTKIRSGVSVTSSFLTRVPVIADTDMNNSTGAQMLADLTSARRSMTTKNGGRSVCRPSRCYCLPGPSPVIVPRFREVRIVEDTRIVGLGHASLSSKTLTGTRTRKERNKRTSQLPPRARGVRVL